MRHFHHLCGTFWMCLGSEELGTKAGHLLDMPWEKFPPGNDLGAASEEHRWPQPEPPWSSRQQETPWKNFREFIWQVLKGNCNTKVELEHFCCAGPFAARSWQQESC